MSNPPWGQTREVELTAHVDYLPDSAGLSCLSRFLRRCFALECVVSAPIGRQGIAPERTPPQRMFDINSALARSPKGGRPTFGWIRPRKARLCTKHLPPAPFDVEIRHRSIERCRLDQFSSKTQLWEAILGRRLTLRAAGPFSDPPPPNRVGPRDVSNRLPMVWKFTQGPGRAVARPL